MDQAQGEVRQAPRPLCEGLRRGRCILRSRSTIVPVIAALSLWRRWYRRSGEKETVITLTMVPPSGWATERAQHRPPHFSSTPRGRTEDAACRRLQHKGTLRSAGSGRSKLHRGSSPAPPCAGLLMRRKGSAPRGSEEKMLAWGPGDRAVPFTPERRYQNAGTTV